MLKHTSRSLVRVIAVIISLIVILTSFLGSNVKANAADPITPEVTLAGIYPHYNSNWTLNSYEAKFTIKMDQPRTFGMKQAANTMGVYLVNNDGSNIYSGANIDGYTYTTNNTTNPDGYSQVFTPTASATDEITLTFHLPSTTYWNLATAFKYDFMFLEKQADGTYKQLTTIPTSTSTTGTQTGSSLKTRWLGYKDKEVTGYGMIIHDIAGVNPDLRVMCIDPFTYSADAFTPSVALTQNAYYQRIEENDPTVGTEQGILSTLGQGAGRRWNGADLVKHLKMAYYFVENNAQQNWIYQKFKAYYGNDTQAKYWFATFLGWMYATNASGNFVGRYGYESIFRSEYGAMMREPLQGATIIDVQNLLNQIDAQSLTQEQLDSVTLTFWAGAGGTVNGSYPSDGNRPMQTFISYDYSPSVSLNVVKVEDGNSTRKLQGAKFELRDSEGVRITTATSDANGNLSFSKLKAGKTYTIKEIVAPEGYELNPTVFTVTVNASGNGVTVMNGSTTVPLTNGSLQIADKPTVRAQFTLHKVELGKTSKALANAVFTLTNADGVVTDKTTDGNGDITFDNLAPGTYKLKEKTAPAGYELNTEEITVTVSNTGAITFTNAAGQTINLTDGKLQVTDKKIYGKLILHKVDVDAQATVLRGAEFTLTNIADNTSVKQTTGTDGNVSFENLETGATYKLKETKAPSGYELSNAEYTVTVANDGTVKVTDANGAEVSLDAAGQVVITNKKAPKGHFKIHKVDGANINTSLNNAMFVLYKNGQMVTVKSTMNGGYATFDNLDPGQYTLTELQAPSGYMKTDVTYTITVHDDGKVSYTSSTGAVGTSQTDLEIVIKNYPNVPPKMRFWKTTLNDGQEEPITSGTLKLKLERANSSAAPINDGRIIYTLDLTKQENGPLEIKFPAELEGEYLLTEEEAPEGYIRTRETFHITIVKEVTASGITKKVIFNSDSVSNFEAYTWANGTENWGSASQIRIYNEQPQYPATGGGGTIAFYATGGVIMAAGVMLAWKKRFRQKF